MGRLLPLLLVLLVPAAADDFAFSGLEIYKLDDSIREPLARDVDGDGLLDLLIVNNDRARVEVFLRRREKVPPKKTVAEKLPNDLLDDQYFERKEILTEKQVASLVAGDFNGDGHVDVAYYGKPEELVVAFGDGTGAFPKKRGFDIAEGSEYGSGLAAGDLDGNGRDDLALLTKDNTALLLQNEKGRLEEPVKRPHSDKGAGSVFIEDLDGDGRDDLVLVHWSSGRGLRVAFQREDGSLGAEGMFETTPWRYFVLADLDPAPGTEILVVQRSSGVLRALGVRRTTRSDYLGSPEVHAFDQSKKAKSRRLALGDVDGDGRTDLVVTEPGTAQVTLCRQDDEGGLRGRRAYPSLSNSEAVRAADLDGDGKAEVVVLSRAEKAVGVASWGAEGLPFPRLLDLPGTPQALDCGDLDGDGRADLAVVVEPDKKTWTVLLFRQQEAGGLTAEPWRTIELEGLKQAPEDLRIADLDQDGAADLLLFDKYDAARLLRATGEGYEDWSRNGTKYRGGLVQGLSRGQANLADLDGDGKAELVACSQNYARAIVAADGGLSVKDQANGATPRAQVAGATAADLDGDGRAEVMLYDKDAKAVTVLKREEGVFSLAATVPVGDLDYEELAAADLNGDGVSDLVLLGEDRFAVCYGRGQNLELVELNKIECTERDASLVEVAVGRLNEDAKPDVVTLDRRRFVQTFSYDPKAGFSEHNRWRIYEKKMHDERRKEGGAHSLVIADFDADGRSDLALLVHDRLLVYPR